MAELSVADGTLEDDNMDTRVLKAVFGASTDKVQSLRFTAAGLSWRPKATRFFSTSIIWAETWA
ncbi:MAG: hypothetical protein ACLRSW_04230 [Christensenellaceae bacterium]